MYQHITAHYMWAFDQLFGCAGYGRVVVLEDDMLVAPDLFAYFEATAKLLDQVGASDRDSPCCVQWTTSGTTVPANLTGVCFSKLASQLWQMSSLCHR